MSAYYKPLRAVPDQEDIDLHKKNCDTALVTERLGELVPLLKFVGFRVEQMRPEKTVLVVPLLETAMNQNGTQQAAVFYLIADYTLGVGMFAALPGAYTVGVHDRCRALPMQFWLRSGHVTHLAPGTGAIRAEVTLSQEKIQSMREQILSKGRCIIKDTVRIYQNDKLVATTEHEMGLYADLPRITDSRVSINQVERLKTSALMLAALRGDPLSLALAGEQGIAISHRMTRASPQLPALIAARTTHLRRYLKGEGASCSQVLVLGVGLDSKPVEFASPDQVWFLADLRDMLRERDARLAALGNAQHCCIAIPVDLRLSDWPKKIIDAGFDPAKSTLIIFEGVSMYLSADELHETLGNIQSLCRHSDSCLWLDHVTGELLRMERPEVRAFLSSMARLGEPFVTGFSDPSHFSGSPAWRLREHVSASEILDVNDPIYREYRFAVMGTDNLSVPGG